MSSTGVGSPRPMPRSVLGAAVVILALTSVLALWAVNDRPAADPEVAGGGLQVSVAVLPFEVGDLVPRDWNAKGFADSLASHLSRIRGIHASTHTSNARYVLRGHVTMKEGRLILATRLGREGERDTVWTATFWRSAVGGSSVLTDVAQAVAEAVFSENVREPFQGKREKP